MVRPPYAAVIFDMDGVVTDSAAMHAEAWKRLFDEVLTDPRLPEHSRGMPPFDIVDDYRRLADGRSREDGVRAVLASGEIDLPTGAEDEGADGWSVSGLAAQKNEIFLDILAQRGVRVFPGTGKRCCSDFATVACRPAWSQRAGTPGRCWRRPGSWTCSPS